MRTVVRRCGKLWSLSEKISVNNEAKTKVSKFNFEKGHRWSCAIAKTRTLLLWPRFPARLWKLASLEAAVFLARSNLLHQLAWCMSEHVGGDGVSQ